MSTIISGRQCTLGGRSLRAEVQVYGAVDSIREPDRSTFAHHQYPSPLPRSVLGRMTDVAERVVKAGGFADAAFNVDLLWGQAADRIWLVEVNPRPSQSHFKLFKKVDGVPNVAVGVDLARGRRPDLPHRQGRWPLAAKNFIRHSPTRSSSACRYSGRPRGARSGPRRNEHPLVGAE